MKNKIVPIRLILLIILGTFLFPPIDAEAGRGWYRFNAHGYMNTRIDGSTEFFTKSQFRIGLGLQYETSLVNSGSYEVYFLKRSDALLLPEHSFFTKPLNYDEFIADHLDKVVNLETIVDITSVEDGYENPILCNQLESDFNPIPRFCGEKTGYWNPNRPLESCEVLDVFIFRHGDLQDNEQKFFGSSRTSIGDSSFVIGPCDKAIYVDKSATAGENTGTDWANAYTDLNSALDYAGLGDAIWVAKGVYRTSSSGFGLLDGIAIYGGFAGTETELSERDWETNVTVLSGDIDGDDIVDANGVVLTTADQVGENSDHVVTSDEVTAKAVLDGFTITGGQANGTGDDSYGGGMHNNSNPTLINITFSGNSASYGGGIYNNSSSPTLTNVTFTGNSSSTNGGGMFNNQDSNPMLTNVTFSGNTSIYGGGMSNDYSDPTLTNVTFNGNSSTVGGGMSNYYSDPTLTNVTFSGNNSDFGGGLTNYLSSPILSDTIFDSNNSSINGGGMLNDQESKPTLTNVTFSSNTSISNGGGMYNESNSSPTLSNVTFSGNYSSGNGGGMASFNSSITLINITFSGNSSSNGGGMYNSNSSPAIGNSIFWNNRAAGVVGTVIATISNNNGSNPTISHSLIQSSGGSGAWNSGYGADGGNNIDSDPLFVTPVDPTTAPTLLGDLQLQVGSPAIDVGSNASYTSPVTTDLAGNDRIQNSIIDMGAYEWTVYLLTTAKSGSGSGSLSSNPAAINCGTTCTASFLPGTLVTLTASPASGSSFTGWSGAGCSGTGNCVVTMDQAQSVIASFAIIPPTTTPVPPTTTPVPPTTTPVSPTATPVPPTGQTDNDIYLPYVGR